MAKLKPNMAEIDSTTIHQAVVTEKEHFFHEGGYLIKRDGIYYFIYAHMGRADRPTCIGYATSRHPFGPYTYGGVIVDNDHCDPSSWNNHGSVVEFNGQWYVFYHRSTHNSYTMRKACVEPIRFNPDGSIDEVEMTTQGAAPPIDARQKMEAERACLLFGDVYVKAIAPDNEALVNIRNDNKAAYKYINFSSGVDSLIVSVNPGTNGGSISVILDQSWGSPVGRIEIPGKEKAGESVILRQKIRPIDGVHALWLRFDGEGDDLFQVDWFTFN
jgi:hypothetical protein